MPLGCASGSSWGSDGENPNVGTVYANALGTPATGTWYFVVGWHVSANNTLNIQVNNGTVNSVAWSAEVLSGSADFAIGARRDTLPLYFDGRREVILTAHNKG
jgi:hypothetical protein